MFFLRPDLDRLFMDSLRSSLLNMRSILHTIVPLKCDYWYARCIFAYRYVVSKCHFQLVDLLYFWHAVPTYLPLLYERPQQLTQHAMYVQHKYIKNTNAHLKRILKEKRRFNLDDSNCPVNLQNFYLQYLHYVMLFAGRNLTMAHFDCNINHDAIF